MSVENKVEIVPDIPDELKPVDLFFRQAMEQKNAPDYVWQAWNGFLTAVSKWTAEENAKAKEKK